MFSAILVTRTLLKVLVGTSVMRHLWLFGHDVEEARARHDTDAHPQLIRRRRLVA